jgi:hypothetical protein
MDAVDAPYRFGNESAGARSGFLWIATADWTGHATIASRRAGTPLGYERGFLSYAVLAKNTGSSEQAFLKRDTVMSELLIDLWQFIKQRKKFWLLPIIAVLTLAGALIVLTEGSVATSFIYALF